MAYRWDGAKPVLGLFMAGVALALFAASITTAPAERAVAAARRRVEVAAPGLQITRFEASPVPGLFFMSTPGAAGHVTADGRYFIVGDMFELASGSNVTEIARRSARRALLRDLDPRGAVVFPAARPRHTVTVFTDVDCPYCRKLHGEVARLNGLGVAVRYLAFPRAGPGSDAWRRMQAVWCAEDRRTALGHAMAGRDAPPPGACDDGPVRAHYALAQALEIPGTPIMLLDDGTVLGGYLAPEALLAELERLAAAP